MKPDEHIPIEPLSDASWDRIERSVFEELDDRARAGAPQPARSSLPRWAAIGLAAAVVLQVVVAAVLLIRQDEQDAPEQLASARYVSERETTRALLGDVAVELEPASALVVVEHAPHGSLCVLERGAVRFSVPPRGQRPPFVVQAGDVRVEVIGTRFRVERVAGSAAVETYEGKVRVVAGGLARIVTRGQPWSGAAAPAPAPVLAPGLAPAPAAEPAGVASESARAGAPVRADRQRARFEQAAAREASDPQHALRIYRALAAESGAWAQNALFAAGRLELELGDQRSAERALRSYLARHPAGANAADARALLRRLNRQEEKP